MVPLLLVSHANHDRFEICIVENVCTLPSDNICNHGVNVLYDIRYCHISKPVVAVRFHKSSPIPDPTPAGHCGPIAPVSHCAQVTHCIH